MCGPSSVNKACDFHMVNLFRMNKRRLLSYRYGVRDPNDCTLQWSRHLGRIAAGHELEVLGGLEAEPHPKSLASAVPQAAGVRFVTVPELRARGNAAIAHTTRYRMRAIGRKREEVPRHLFKRRPVRRWRLWAWMKPWNFITSQTEKAAVISPARSQFPSSLTRFIPNPWRSCSASSGPMAIQFERIRCGEFRCFLGSKTVADRVDGSHSRRHQCGCG